MRVSRSFMACGRLTPTSGRTVRSLDRQIASPGAASAVVERVDDRRGPVAQVELGEDVADVALHRDLGTDRSPAISVLLRRGASRRSTSSSRP